MTFEPNDVIVENLGKIQVVIDNVDYTRYRGVPTIVESFSKREPFGDAAATIRFPGITPFEPETSLPFISFNNIDINLVDLNGDLIENLFEGMVVSYDEAYGSGGTGITVQAVGALYQADFFIKPPIFSDYPFDIATGIARELNTRSTFYGLRTQLMDTQIYTNVTSKSRGSWNPVLTGWIQDLLANSWTDGFMLKGEQAVALLTTSGTESYGLWMLGHLGSNLSLGQRIPFYGSSSYLTQYVASLYSDTDMFMRDMAARPQHDGFWVLDRRGKVIPYGDAAFYGDHSDPRIAAWAIESTITGEGYWILDASGNIYEYGDAVDYGDGPTLTPYLGWDDATIDMSVMPDGAGYRVLTRVGHVISYGSAVDYGESLMTDRFFVAIQNTPTGDGYWTLDTYGRVYAFGDAVDYGESSSPNSWAVDLAISPTGEGYAILIDTGRIDYYGDFRDVGSVEWSIFAEHGANIYQWSLTKDTGRKPRMYVKNNWDTHWTVTVGTPGVEHSLARDYKWAPNVYYGEGIDNNNCRWRNSRYPNVHPDSAPVWPGYYISVAYNSTSAGATLWQQRMHDTGWPVTVDGVYDAEDQSACQRFQEMNGLVVDGIVGPQTWAAVFAVGENAGNLNAAYFAPLAQIAWVEPFTYDATGAITGPNSWWDNSYIRIESYDNYGEHTEKADAIISAQARLRSQSGPNFVGTITLKTDPIEGSRFLIKEGQNILYRGYKTYDVLFHISEVSFNMQDLSVTLTVDTAFRDAGTVDAIMKRNYEMNNPSLTPTRHQSAARMVEDRISVWDCESGAGIIPRMGIGANIWQVIRIPAGEFGQIISTSFNTDSPTATYSVAVFDRPITASYLQNYTPAVSAQSPTPVVANPNQDGFWATFPDDQGLVISWGGDGTMAGYYPGRGDQGEPPTGVLVDRGSWTYWTTTPPWLWIAFYCTETTYIQGRFYPGQEGYGYTPDFSAVAEPTGLI